VNLLSADTSAVEPTRRKLSKFIKDHKLALDQGFNCDEACLFWRSYLIKPKLAVTIRQPKVLRNLKIGLAF